MKFPKPIYEKLPYLYFLLSGFLLMSGQSFVFLCSAALLYSAGCMALVKRSLNRRLDNPSRSKKYFIPEFIYEYTPYGYGALAVYFFINTANPYIQFAAFFVGICAIRIFLFRHNNRCKAKALF